MCDKDMSKSAMIDRKELDTFFLQSCVNLTFIQVIFSFSYRFSQRFTLIPVTEPDCSVFTYNIMTVIVSDCNDCKPI